jgi:3-dehydroquinate dehydratase II
VTPTIFVLNGPNLNLLGEREPQIYGRETLADIESACRAHAQTQQADIDFRQTNFEGELIESVHEARKRACGIVINPAGLSFTSIPLLDALKTFDGPILEVHISNIHRREELYHRSLVSRVATAVIAGLGSHGYLTGIDAVMRLQKNLQNDNGPSR